MRVKKPNKGDDDSEATKKGGDKAEIMTRWLLAAATLLALSLSVLSGTGKFRKPSDHQSSAKLAMKKVRDSAKTGDTASSEKLAGELAREAREKAREKARDNKAVKHLAPDGTSPTTSHLGQVRSKSSASLSVFTAQMLPIAEVERNKIAEHGPIKAMLTTAREEIFFLTQSHLWLYDLSSEKLGGLQIKEDAKELSPELAKPSESLSYALIPWGSGYLVKAGADMVLVKAPPSFEAVLIKMEDSGFLGAGILGGQRSLMTDQWLWQFDEKLQVDRRWPLPSGQDLTQLSSPDHGTVPADFWRSMKVVFGGDEALILHTQRHIWYWQLTAGGGKSGMGELSLVGSYFRQIRKVHRIGDDQIAIETPYSMIVMTVAGDILKIIPVSQIRKLRYFIPSLTEHTYLFDDHHLEIYRGLNSSEPKLWHGTLSLEPTKHVSHFDRQGDRLVFVVDGELKIFRLDFQRPAVARGTQPQDVSKKRF